MTSGAIQNGVPTNVPFLSMVSLSCPATPKSASFTSPVSDNRTFAAEVNKEQNKERFKYECHLPTCNYSISGRSKLKTNRVNEILTTVRHSLKS